MVELVEKRENYLTDLAYFETTKEYSMLKENLSFLLDWLNLAKYEVDDCITLVENNPGISVLVEKVDGNLAPNLILYNHHSTVGNLELKRSILVAIARVLEPYKDSALKERCPAICNSFFSTVNNFNVRHNNISEDSKHYKEKLDKLTPEELEEKYDECYQEGIISLLILTRFKFLKQKA